MKKIKEFLKNYFWYGILLLSTSYYILLHREQIDELAKLESPNLIFIFWLLLLAFPLFSEMEIGIFKIKKYIKQTKEELETSIKDVKLQILETKISNSNTILFNQPLPSKEELSEINKNIELHKENNQNDLDLNIPDQNILLFKVRLTIESLISSICDKIPYAGNKSMTQMVRHLIKHEYISSNTAELILQVVNIANRGVHGEIVSDEYIQFVKNAFPTIKKSLKDINRQKLFGLQY